MSRRLARSARHEEAVRDAAALEEAQSFLNAITMGVMEPAQWTRLGELMPRLPSVFKAEVATLVRHIQAAPEPIPFREFVSRAKPDYRWYDFAERIHDRLMDVAEGRLRRLMIFAPPRHGKSELVSRLFSAYYQYRFPYRWVGLTSYGSDLAFMLARSARDNFVRAGGKLGAQRDEEAVRTIGTGSNGGMWAAGVGGPITGKGFHLGIVDDPLKNSAEAKSVTIRENHKDWWKGTFYTRREPNAAIVLIMTPWHEDDLCNWLLRRENGDPGAHPERWHIMALDGLRDTSEKFFVPSTCTLEPDPRKHMEALAPERYPVEELLRMKASMGSYYFSAMVQARPKPQEGVLFKSRWFTRLRAMPTANVLAAVRYWDLAATEKEDATEHDPDFTRGVLCLAVRVPSESDTAGTGSQRIMYVFAHGTGGQMGPKRRDDHIVVTAERDAAMLGAHGVVTWLERDSGGGGKDRTKAILSKLARFRVRTEPPLGMSKELRAEPLRDQAEAGNVAVVEGEWTAGFMDELTGFPYAKHDDYVDAAVGAFVKCVDMVSQIPDAEALDLGAIGSAPLSVSGVPGSAGRASALIAAARGGPSDEAAADEDAHGVIGIPML